jgi:predicted MFS family arabinose efflux permease
VLFRSRHLPAGIRPPALSLRSWRKVLKSPLLMAVVAVTACQSAGQFTVLGYTAPYYKQVFGASPEQISLMFTWFGALALAGNVLLNRSIDRVGAAPAVTLTLALMALSLLIWPLASSLPVLAAVLLPWAISGFATNSGQQARLGGLSPRLAPALMALNTSAIYLGHALGASGGGWVISHHGYEQLHRLGLAWMLVALALSLWAQRVQQRADAHRGSALKPAQPLR